MPAPAPARRVAHTGIGSRARRAGGAGGGVHGGLERLEGDAHRERGRCVDAWRPQRERDGAAADADVPGRSRTPASAKAGIVMRATLIGSPTPRAAATQTAPLTRATMATPVHAAISPARRGVAASALKTSRTCATGVRPPAACEDGDGNRRRDDRAEEEHRPERERADETGRENHEPAPASVRR